MKMKADGLGEFNREILDICNGEEVHIIVGDYMIYTEVTFIPEPRYSVQFIKGCERQQSMEFASDEDIEFFIKHLDEILDRFAKKTAEKLRSKGKRAETKQDLLNDMHNKLEDRKNGVTKSGLLRKLRIW